MFLRTDEMKQYITEARGEMAINTQTHVNHRDCTAGMDRKKRLYIKRTPDAFLFYCQHCGYKGYYRTVDRLHRASHYVDHALVEKTSGHPLAELKQQLDELEHERDINEWPVEARIWWLSYGLDQHDASLHNVQWDSFSHRLWMSLGGVWQGRSFDMSPSGNKYVTLATDDLGLSLICGDSDPEAPTVLVEDMVSAYKVYKAGRNVLCLMGTKLAPKNKAWLVERDRGVIVWLDDDEAGWVASMKIRTELIPTIRIASVKHYQPKEVDIETIKSLTTWKA